MEKSLTPSKSAKMVMVVLIITLVMNRSGALGAEPRPHYSINRSKSCFIPCMIYCGIQGDSPPVCIAHCRKQCPDSPPADHIIADQLPCTVGCIKSIHPNLALSDVGKVESSIDSCSEKCSKTQT